MNRKLSLLTLAPIILALAAAIISGCAVNQSGNLAGRINGKPIPGSSYWDAYRGHYNNFQILNNRPPDNEEKEMLKRQTWKDATRHVILTEHFRKYDIRVSNQEVIDTLKNNVPEYILRSPKFMTNGVFDPKIYFQSLQFDTPENLLPLRKDYQDYKIPIMRLQKHLIEDELMGSADRKLATRILQSQADIEWTILDINDMDPVVSEEEILMYYQRNNGEFSLNPFYKVAWTSIRVTPSKTDTQTSMVLADSISAQLARGYTVAEVITKHSDDFPWLEYKNSGFLRNSDLDPAVYALLSELAEGGFSKPVGDSEGYTIYELEQRTKSMVSFFTLRIPYIPSQTSIDLELLRAQRVGRLASSIGLAEAASEMDLPFKRTGRIEPNETWTEDLAVETAILGQLPGKEAGHVFEPAYSAQQQSWLIVELLEYGPAKVKTLEQVQEQIRIQLANAKKTGLALNLADQIIAGRAAAPASAKIVRLETMNPGTVLQGMGFENVFYQTLRRHLQKERQQSFQYDNLIFIPRVLSYSTDRKINIAPADAKRVFAANLPANWFETWMVGKIQKADVKIFLE
ncbi:MAG: SurA N-terminal domain-containing protein [Candidatus Syntrophosphaera sp.]|nr:SurA N-terminal domain-containing protein [Candidatus Syntrophosphaera sp.]